MDEDTLIKRVQGGDLKAFEPLVDAHLPDIRAFLALKVPAAHMVDELGHETFVYAFRHIHEFAPGTALRFWLRTIAWNLLRAEILRFSREQANQMRYAQEHYLRLANDKTDPTTSHEVQFLGECVEQLPTAARTLVDLKYHREHSADQIAAHLQRSTVWVRTTLFRIRQRLKDCIQGKQRREQPC
jgi:RNA polymerase sigma-70 factor (ECF subfamily)